MDVKFFHNLFNIIKLLIIRIFGMRINLPTITLKMKSNEFENTAQFNHESTKWKKHEILLFRDSVFPRFSAEY